MTYDGTEGNLIPRLEARSLLDNYQNSTAFEANNNTEGLLFGRVHLESILAQPGCKGVRVYFGKQGVTPNSPAQLVIVGTDENGDNMPGLILDAGVPCPPFCPSEDTKL